MENKHLERLGKKIDKTIELIGKKSTNVMLINYYDNKGLTKDEVDSILCKDKYIICYHEFQCNKMSKVYEPFVEWIKDAYEQYIDLSLDEFFDVCDVYMAHRTIFKSYFETGIGKRDEFLYLNDIDFEVKKMFEGILSMISFISKQKPVVFVLNKLQFSGSSTMELLNCFFETAGTEQIVLLATFNVESAVLSQKKIIWKQLVDHFDEINCIYDWDKFEEKVTAEREFDAQDYELSELVLQEKMQNIHNMSEFLALSQAFYNLQNLYHKFEIEKFDVSTDLKFKVYKMYIKACAETNAIVEGFEVKSSLNQLVYNDEKRFEYYVMQAFLEMANKQFAEARETIRVARQYVNGEQKRQDTLDIFDYIARVEYWDKDWQDSDLKEEELFIIETAERLNFKGLLSRIYLTGFENDKSFYEKLEGLEERLVYHNKGFQLGEELGNAVLQLNGCFKPLIISSTFAYTEVVNYFYKEKCIPLARKCHDLIGEAIIYIGLGYNSTCSEEFDDASKYFNKALIIQYQSENLGFMLETLYNMTVNAIMVEDYQSADNYVSACIYAVENMRKDAKIGILHLSKLYGYKALCCYFLGNQYKSKIYLSHQKRMLDYVLESDKDIDNFELWYDELFSYYYVNGLIYNNGDLYENAIECLEQALFYSEKSEGFKFFTYARCQIELARVYMMLEKKQKAVKCIQDAIEFAKEEKLKKQRLKLLLFLREITGEDWITEEDEDEFAETRLIWEKGSLERELSGISIADVKERIRNIGILNRSQEEKERMEFLSAWSQIINAAAPSIEEMIQNVLFAFCENFQIENLLFISIQDDQPSVMYKNLAYEIDDEMAKVIYEYAKRNPKVFSASRMEEYFYDYKELMSLFNISEISSFMFIPIIERDEVKHIIIMYMTMKNIWGTNMISFMLNHELHFLFSSAMYQLADAIEREQFQAELRAVNKKLRDVALVDNLTGLFNRQGLEYHLTQILSEKNKITAILYIDLDHFKYYNDTFGHKIGDLILVSFANIIKTICEGKGFAVRYGGDEFLIIMNMEQSEEGMEIAKTLFDLLHREQAFIPLVERALGKTIEISDDKKVSCSVGISVLDKQQGDKAFDIALKQADDALYYIKRTGKCRYEMWRPEGM